MTTISSPEEMFALGKKLAKEHKILLLEGELGSGKTTLTKGFAEGIGIIGDTVQSPTYTYINIYENKLLHIDMRRIQKARELIEKGILDQMNDYEYIVIERPKHTDILPFKTGTKIMIKKTSPTKREVSITAILL